MSIYSTPFGYKVEMGKIVVDPEESIIVKQIFNWGSQGYSLSKISKMVSQSFPIVQFNKNKVSRILKDARYVGNDIFESIIDQASFERVDQNQTNMSTRGGEKAEVLKVAVPVICPTCQSIMKRFHDLRRKCPDRWACTREQCSFQIRFSDDDFISELQAIVTGIKNTDKEIESDSIRRNFVTAKLEADILDDLKTRTAETEQIRADILRLALLKYGDITITGRAKSVVKESLNLYRNPEEYIELLNRAASQIRIEADKSLTVILKDGSEHRRLSEHDDSSLRQREEDHENCSNASVG